MTPNKAIHVFIYGRVQGVGFRAWIHHQAQLHGLKGWVRNRRDGPVEAVFSGPEDLIEVMLKACHHGPVGSAVERVEIVKDETADFRDSGHFDIAETV